MPATDCQQLYSNLVTAVIRVGQADDALSLMKERKRGDGDSGMGQVCLCSYLDIYQDTRVFISCFIQYNALHIAFRCILSKVAELKRFQRS